MDANDNFFPAEFHEILEMDRHLQATRAEHKQLLVQTAALRALAAANALELDLTMPFAESQLRAIQIDDDDPASLRVLAVDRAGKPRMGNSGPLTAEDVVAELKAKHPTLFRQ